VSSLLIEVCAVDEVFEHPNADRLDIAVIKGWNCVVGRNQYKPGDKVIFVPPDSIIPEEIIESYKLYTEEPQEDGTIKRKTYFKNGNRVGTTKLRGCVSQGLILSIPEGTSFSIGQDVATELGITKWEPPAAGFQGEARPSRIRLNPLFDKYTDIENVKNYNSLFKEDDEVVILEKIHGTNFRAGKLPMHTGKGLVKRIISYIKQKLYGTHEFVYGSHNVELKSWTGNKSSYGCDVYAKMAEKYKLDEVLKNDHILYGEIYGKGIQDLTYGLEEVDLVVFDMKVDGNYLDWDEVVQFCTINEIPMVPELYRGKFSQEKLKELTDGKSIKCPKQIREGCVVKTLKETNNILVGRKILKSVSVNYLTRKDATEYH
jgi:RNA ligase (TIGR02306 family)